MSFFEAIQQFLNPEHLSEEELFRERKERILRNYDKEEYELKTGVEGNEIEEISNTSPEDDKTTEEERSEISSQDNDSDTSETSSEISSQDNDSDRSETSSEYSSSDNTSEMSDTEKYIEEIEESMGTISLSGKELMKDLQDALETEFNELGDESINIDKFSEQLTARFIKTVSVATTGFGLESSLFSKGNEILEGMKGDPNQINRYSELAGYLTDIEQKYRLIRENQLLAAKEENKEGKEKYEFKIPFYEEGIEELKQRLFEKFPELEPKLNQSTLSEKEIEDIKNSIKQATTKLAEELKKEKEGYYLWKSTNSLTAANKERSFLNIVGQLYDCIGNVCHKASVILGLKDKTAAELFAEVANNAKEIHKKFSSAQIERDEQNKNASKYYGFNRGNMERDEDSLKEAVAAKNQETMDKTITELGNLLKNTYKNPQELNEAISKFDLVDKHVGKNVEKLLKERETKENGVNKQR